MKQPPENSEFRACHAANLALQLYKKTKDLGVISSIPINSINQGDYCVWLCIFEKEPEAYKLLEQKELYQLFGKDNYDELPDMAAMLALTILTRKIEENHRVPVSPENFVKIVVDIMGDSFITFLQKEAKEHVARRREIIKPYFKKDNEWVGYSVKAQEIIEEYAQKAKA